VGQVYIRFLAYRRRSASGILPLFSGIGKSVVAGLYGGELGERSSVVLLVARALIPASVSDVRRRQSSGSLRCRENVGSPMPLKNWARAPARCCRSPGLDRKVGAEATTALNLKGSLTPPQCGYLLEAGARRSSVVSIRTVLQSGLPLSTTPGGCGNRACACRTPELFRSPGGGHQIERARPSTPASFSWTPGFVGPQAVLPNR